MADVLIHAKKVDEITMKQIEAISHHPVVKGLVAIMPDCHAGAGCVIGFTGKFVGGVIPNVVGVDIGCGVSAVCLNGIKRDDVNFGDLDRYIRAKIPLGMKHHKDKNALAIMRREYPALYEEMISLSEKAETDFYGGKMGKKTKIPPWSQYGTLGGGNHFIEIDHDPQTKELYLVVHTGSRHFGYDVANFFQREAKKFCRKRSEHLPSGLEYLPLDEGGAEYMKWLVVAQRYAELNRFTILAIILRYWGEMLREDRLIQSVHNYISQKDGIVRKGAISAHKGEKVIIPLNMAEGVVIGLGKGNELFNYSAPHGAGRAYGRKEMKRMLERGQITLETFRKSMEGVFSTSISKDTIDEAPMAYKNWEDIQEELQETVDIEKILKPVYNLKAPE
ncbi:protein of unknown function UPF0027 [Thermovirga lienii DSM 17291]|uniref:3'-phosphate/5'-hydroxy nucleic acid ligase n=1 Tax=Thermovirga lienii (strain ATCC BAA-1197 / DSM 17291 / Cas60314) TaxID=580340 RepID=G7V6J8_THELD|nr:RNA-splicing ligase RtcB [Thermovirga lienii]AER67111.1 protein of unknown function UPF0027 [Thermovirga lienii DSM 17291]